MEDSSPKPIRVWPAVTLIAVFWVARFIVSQTDIGMFPRFLWKSLGTLAFLLVFLILWLSNGTLRWKVRLAGLGSLIAGLVAGILAAHRSLDPVSFLMLSLPVVMTAWTLWMLAARRIGARPATVAGALLLTLGMFDLIRWDGVDGRLRDGVSWRWSTTAEQAFLASRAAAPPVGRSTRPWTLRAGDWPEFRGPQRDGIIRGVRLETNWKDAPPEKVWKQAVGPGWSSVIVVDGFLVTQEQRLSVEVVSCYEAETGKEVWVHQETARFEEGIAGAGPRATPTFRDGRIYAYGGSGILVCLDAASGKQIWSRDLSREASAATPMWGYSASPLVADGKVIVFVGGGRGTVACDAATGEPAWSREGGKESYSSAQLVSLRGKPQLVMQDSKRTVGLTLSDGAVLWERANADPNIIPMLQPHPQDDGAMFLSTGQDIALLNVHEEAGKWTLAERWTSPRFHPTFDDFVVHEGHVYGLDNGVLSCVSAATGQRVWKKGRYGSGQVMLLADQGALVVLSEQGELALVDARPQEPGDVFRFQALKGKTWNHPVIVKDRLYLRNAEELACYTLRLLKSP
jgi:outer membrane protein assembly factor BamB